MTPKLYLVNGFSPGRLFLSSRPRGGDWLEVDVMGWRRFGIDRVVSLLTEEEERELDLVGESSEVRKHNLNFVSYPILDRGIPQTTTVASFLEAIHLDLLRGETILVHCRQGIGRTGLVAASLLIRKGEKPQSAIQEVTRARGLRIPETAEQEDWIYQVEGSVKGIL